MGRAVGRLQRPRGPAGAIRSEAWLRHRKVATMSRLERIGLALVGLAAVLAVLASLYFFFYPLEVVTITASATAGGREVVEETTVRRWWYQEQGWWGVFVLVLFAGYYGAAYWLARRRAAIWVAVFGIGALVLAFLSGFSIGFLYLPSALLLLVGAGLLVLGRRS